MPERNDYSEPTTAREEYWSESIYFALDDPYAVGYPSRLLTAQRVAGWADSYVAWVSGEQFARREGSFAGDAKERASLVAELFDWLAEQASGAVKPGLNLLAGDALVLDCYDDERGRLWLTTVEYTALQTAWRQHGLPDDLYYPIRMTRVAVEPEERSEGIVLIRRFYSPRAWARRDPAAIWAREMPSEAESLRDLAAACQTFLTALSVRLHQLRGPQPPVEPTEHSWLGELHGFGRPPLSADEQIESASIRALLKPVAELRRQCLQRAEPAADTTQTHRESAT